MRSDNVWIMLHSGSRGVGNRIGSYFIELAKEDMRRLQKTCPTRISRISLKEPSISTIMWKRWDGRRSSRARTARS